MFMYEGFQMQLGRYGQKFGALEEIFWRPMIVLSSLVCGRDREDFASTFAIRGSDDGWLHSHETMVTKELGQIEVAFRLQTCK